jgi:hypothetical protein
MGVFANRPGVQMLALAATAVVLILNLVLLLQTAGIPLSVPGLD